ncbi:MAG: cysteine desulfurase [Lachnospiraceae bacterium]|nr:cysteine desulfurase [Lachnospiraceae bacterium]
MNNDFKKDFAIFEGNDIIYFDNAATAQRPRKVMEAMTTFNDTCNANPLRGLYDWSVRATAAYEEAREKTAAFIGAQTSEEIIFTRNATESLNLVAYSYGLSHIKEGDEIVISVMEHHSNILPWQMVARERKAKLVFLECDEEGTIAREEYESKITDKTKIVSIMQVSNVLGVTNPVREIADYAHAKGAVVIVDGAQSVPHRAVDVQALHADFLAFSAHKMCGPMGMGVLYGKKELLEDMPPFLTGGEMIEYVTREDATFAELPHKFEAGTVNAQGAAGLSAAIDYLRDVGFDRIRETEDRLTKRLMAGMQELPYITICGANDPLLHSGIVTFNIEGCHPHDVSSVLDTEGICIRAGHHCAQPLMKHLGVQSTARASLYFYNTEEEVDRFLEKLGKVREWLGIK